MGGVSFQYTHSAICPQLAKVNCHKLTHMCGAECHDLCTARRVTAEPNALIRRRATHIRKLLYKRSLTNTSVPGCSDLRALEPRYICTYLCICIAVVERNGELS